MSSHRRFIYICLPFAMIAALVIATIPIEAVQAAPVTCTGNIIAFGRKKYCGYFENDGYNTGHHVRAGGVPASVNTAAKFITLIKNDLALANKSTPLTAAEKHRLTAAQFTVLTMLGKNGGVPKSVSAQQRTDWENSVKSYADISENLSRSTGQNGRIDWFVSQHMACGTVNTFYQDADDVAPFTDSASNSECEDSSHKDQFIVFRDTSGAVLYTIRRLCMNPMGTLKPLELPDPNDEYNLTPDVIAKVGGVSVTGVVEVGDTVEFTYTVKNGGSDPSPSAACTIYGNTHTGYFNAPDPATHSSSGGYSPPATTCPKVFAASPTPQQIAIETVVANTSNRTLCRSLYVTPASATLATDGFERCVPVGSKPYVRSFGGDLSAGQAFAVTASTCANNTTASVVGWSKGSGGGYAGAGAQYAILALGSIAEVSSALGGSGAPAPSGLAFANTGTATAGGMFGGEFGSLPCIPNYYGTLPADAKTSFTTLAATTTGAYRTSGTTTIGGPFPGGRVSLYVDGNLVINNDISIPGNWSAASAPLLQVIVRGNIYVGRNVSKIEGVFSAQPDTSGNGGIVYTCANGTAPVAADTNLFTNCNRQLLIYGSLTGKQVQLQRTSGSLKQAQVNETVTTTSAAEVFMYGPAVWMAQPVTSSSSSSTSVNGYDSITSLPPVL